jgi:hypothetical protein
LAKKKKQQRAKDREAGRTTEAVAPKKQELTDEEKFQLTLQEGLQEEAALRRKRAKAAAKRRVKREKAWLYAHQHMYVKIPGEIPYCVVCRERTDTAWLEKQQEAEQKMDETFETNLEARKPIQEIVIREALEKEHMEKVEAKRISRLADIERAKVGRSPSMPSMQEEESESAERRGLTDSRSRKRDGDFSLTSDSASLLTYMVCTIVIMIACYIN